ncbi:replication factor A protein 3 [Lipomyces japonicus]|uniref:replication factor A protein 3 n=1 Tax=Lipomyces japonicus TaxID=56871 RepID=UPI0034CE4FA0
MSSTPATPRVNAQHLDKFKGQHVRLVGRVTGSTGTATTTFDANGSVTVTSASADREFEQGHVYEVIGIVQPDLSIKAIDGFDWGTNVNLENVNGLVELSQAHREIFF